MLSFVWIRYFVRNLTSAFIISLLLSASIYGAVFVFSRKKREKFKLSLKEKEDAENMFLSLASEETSIVFFEKLAKKKHILVEKKSDYILINYNNSSAKTLLYFSANFKGFGISEFVELYKSIKHENATKIVICCKEITDKQLSSFVLNFKEKFLIFDQYETYRKLYKFYDCYPEITHKYSKEKKMVFKDFMAYSFNKKRTKGYLFSAFILVFSSLFVRASIYYCIIASLLVVFALISQFNPYFNIKSDNEVL